MSHAIGRRLSRDVTIVDRPSTFLSLCLWKIGDVTNGVHAIRPETFEYVLHFTLFTLFVTHLLLVDITVTHFYCSKPLMYGKVAGVNVAECEKKTVVVSKTNEKLAFTVKTLGIMQLSVLLDAKLMRLKG